MRYVLSLPAAVILFAFLFGLRTNGQQQPPIEVAVAEVVLAVRDDPSVDYSIADGTSRLYAFAPGCPKKNNRSSRSGCQDTLFVMSGPIGVEANPMTTGQGDVFYDINLDGTLDVFTRDTIKQPLSDDVREQYKAIVIKLAANLPTPP